MTIEELLNKAKISRKKALNERESKDVLRAYGIPAVEERMVKTTDEAVKAAHDIGFPVVLKGLGDTLLHKTERGLVHLHLSCAEDVRQSAIAIENEAKDELDGFLVQPQIAGRREFVAGLFRDQQFGPVVMFGVGGIFAEAVSDVVFRLAPLSEKDALDMINDIKASRLLQDFRGEKAANRDQLVQTLMGLSRLGIEHPEIAEIDVNPLLITHKGDVCAVDALIVLTHLSPTPSPKRRGESPDFSPFPTGKGGGGLGQFPPRIEPRRIGELFHPKSVAFVGASAQMGKWGHTLVTNTISRGYEGEIYLVNAKGGTIANRPVYKSVADIPGTVDLAVVTVPAAVVPELLPQFREKGIHNVVMITSGFAETGAEGRILEEQLVAKARELDILILGPNTMGICNPHIKFYCTGSHVWPPSGAISVVAQSGNMGTQLIAFAEQQGIGVRGFSGSGNEAMITIEDYLEAFEDDKKTRIIMLYVESVKNGRRFFDIAKRISKKKPIVVLKGGRTKAGNKAAASHTGALTSDIRVFEAVCKQAGIVKVEFPMDLLDLSAAFASLPLPKGKRVGLMTLGGGWGVVGSDLCSEYGLEVPELTPEIIKRIDEVLPPYWSKSNPVDIVGQNDNKISVVVLEELMKWDGCDAVINLGILGRKHLLGRMIDSTMKADPSYSHEFLEMVRQELIKFERDYIRLIVELMEKYQKPVFCVGILTTEEDQTLYRVEGSHLQGLIYETPERAIKALAKMYEYQKFVSR